jgi:hypothetical protein
MSTPAIDYYALANQARQSTPSAKPVDYDSLADQARHFSGGQSPSDLGSQMADAGKSYVGQTLSNLNPVNMVKGVGQFLQHPIDSMWTPEMKELRAQAGEDFNKGNYTDAAIRGLGGTIPIIGPAYAGGLEASTPEEAGRNLADLTSTKLTPKIYGGVGKGLAKAAPKLAENALGITSKMRGFGRTPGTAVLEETKGVRPETIAESGRARINQLTPQVEQAAARVTQPVADLQPARDLIYNHGAQAVQQNAQGVFNQLRPMEESLRTRFATGAPIPRMVTPSELLDLKRGFGQEHASWNPDLHDAVNSTGKRAYGALDQELDRTVPEAAGLNQRISSLIPAVQRAETTSRLADTGQRLLHRVAAHTGSLASGIAGFHYGGVPGGIAAFVAPELISSPTAQMIAARTANAAGNGLQGSIPKVGAMGALIHRTQE